MKKLRYLLEGAVANAAFYTFRLMPFEVASNTGSQLARLFGPRLKAHKTAQRNLRLCFPEKSDDELAAILRGMWDNLGRTAAEFPHVSTLVGEAFDKRVEVTGLEHVRALQEKNQPFVFFACHLANWEISAQSGIAKDFPMTLIYRPANNPYVEELIQHARGKTLAAMFPKGRAGIRAMLATLKEGRPVGMLIDQKYNEGVAIPFFGRDAMTAPFIAEIALKYGVPILPARVVRYPKSRFRLDYLPPLDVGKKDVKNILTEINALFEQWIREHPEQWFWVHNRWPKE